MVIKRIYTEGIKQTKLAKIIGKSGISTPYTNQKKIPNVIIMYIPSEMLLVSPVRMTL